MKHAISWGFRRHRWVLVALAIGVIAAALGLFGWKQYGLGWGEAVYRTLTLFVLDGAADDPAKVGVVLGIARFLAPVATVVGVIAAVFRTAYDWMSRLRAMLGSPHAVVLGGGPEATQIALALRRGDGEAKPRKVVVVGELSAEHQMELRAAGVRWLDAVTEAALEQVVGGCEVVVITAPDDQEASSLTSRVRRLLKRAPKPSMVTLIDSRDVARDWRHRGNDRVVCRAEQVARTVLRVRAPFEEDRVAPPPLVLGDGRIAAELVARIFEGWQQPGESITVHCGGPQPARDYFIDRGLGFSESEATTALWHDDGPQGRGTLVWHELPASTHLAARITKRVLEDWRLSWEMYKKHDRYQTGPIPVYVAFDDDAVTIPVANEIKRTLETQARVVVVPKDQELAKHLCTVINDDGVAQNDGVVDQNDAGAVPPKKDPKAVGVHLESQTATLCSPDELNRKLTDLLARELSAEALRWPTDLPRLYDSDGAPAVAESIVATATEVGLKVVSAPLPMKRVLVFNPTELDAFASGLHDRISSPNSMTEWEYRTLLLELAGRVPALLNRAGRALVRTKGDVNLIPFDKLDHLAQMVHLGYQGVAARTGNATGSQYAVTNYESLPEVVRSSNVAQVLDIPVKLALLGLRFVPRPAVGQDGLAEYKLTADDVEALARQEHRRWAHFEIRNGRCEHNWNVAWELLSYKVREYDRGAVQLIPLLLGEVGLTVAEDSARRREIPDPPPSRPAEGTFHRVGSVYAERLATPRHWATARADALEAEAGDWWVWSADPVRGETRSGSPTNKGSFRCVSPRKDERSVKPEAFERSYELIEGNRYRRIGSVHARQVLARELVQTSEGPAYAEPHDWVITDDQGAQWPVTEEAFGDLYDSIPPKDERESGVQQ